MGNGTRLVKTMQVISQNAGSTTDFVLGKVTSVSPLKIKVGEIELTESFIMLSPLCVDTKINLTHSHQMSGSTKSTSLGSHSHSTTVNSTSYPSTSVDLGSHSHSIELESADDLGIITLWRGLQVGDNVLMLKSANGQKYYALQRQEGLIS